MARGDKSTNLQNVDFPGDIDALIAHGESLTVEFKSDRSDPLNDDSLAELVVCMSNGNGGVALIGVEDDGTVTGLSQKRLLQKSDAIAAMIFNKTEPPIRVGVDRTRVSGEDILLVRVPAIASIAATSSGKCLRRVMGLRGPECVPFPPTQHTSRLADLGLLDYSSSQLAETDVRGDVDDFALARLRSLLRVASPSLIDLGDEELLGALGLAGWTTATERHLTVAGVLCVGTPNAIRRWVPTHQVAFQVLDEAGDVNVNEFFSGPLLTLLDELEVRFAARNREAEVSVGLVRVGVPDYPPTSFREGLLNAVVHRDYARLGAVHIQIHPNHLSISNPGGFPSGVTLDNLLVHDPVPRNRLLADVFLRVGLVERAGRGIDRIYLNQLRNGRPAPDYAGSDSAGVRLELPGGEPSLAFVKFVIEQESRGPGLGLQELLILNYMEAHTRITPDEAQALLQVGPERARTAIQRLLDHGWVMPDRTRGVVRLSAAMYEVLGRPADFVRGGGFARIQQISMIERYVGSYGRIVRSQAADLCRMSSDEARIVLRRMVREDRLVVRGAKRNAWYEPGARFGIGPNIEAKSQRRNGGDERMS